MLLELWYWLGTRGVRVGLGLIALVSVWDVVCTGFRGFFEYSIGWKGLILIWVGVGLIFQAHKIERGEA